MAVSGRYRELLNAERVAVRVDRLQASGIGVLERHTALLVRGTREFCHDCVGNCHLALFCDRHLGRSQHVIVCVDQPQSHWLGFGQGQIHRPIGLQARDREFREPDLIIWMMDNETEVPCARNRVSLRLKDKLKVPAG